MKLALDLNQTAGQRRYGDITVMFSWFGDKNVQSLVLMPTNLIGHERVIPCVVPVTSAWAWDENVGDGAHCARTSFQFAEILGFGKSVDMAVKITSIIRDCLGDLLTMRAKPVCKEVVADAIVTNLETGKTREQEIIANAAS